MTMRRIGPYLGAGLCLIVGWPPAAAAERVTLGQAVAVGVARSPEAGQADARVRTASAAKDRIARSWYPRIEARGVAGFGYLENDRRIALGLSNRREYPLYAALSVDQPLFDSGRRSAELSGGRARIAAARANAEGARQAAALRVAQSYLELLLYARAAAVAADNLAVHEKLAAEMQEGVRKGAISISEQQQAAERLQNAKVRVVDAKRDLASAHVDFEAYTGLADADPEMPPSATAMLPAGADQLIDRIAGTSPRLREAQSALDEAEAAVRRARAEYLPSVDLNARARAGSDYEGYGGTTRDVQALGTFRLPLFDGGVTAARVREARSRADEARFALDEARRDTTREGRLAWERLEAWRGTLAEQDARIGIARSVIESYQAQFVIGRRSLLDVLDSYSALYNARIEAETARFGILLTEYSILASSNDLLRLFGVEPAAAAAGVYGPR